MSTPIRSILSAVSLVLAVAAAPAAQAQGEKAMSNTRLDELIKRLDQKAQGRPGYWTLTIDEREVLVITDERADRMRIITPVIKTEDLDERHMFRLLQANFDSALDARYAVGRDIVWSAFIHPLRTLRDADFISGVGQVINLAETFGSSYSSGAFVFGGGDSGELQRRELIDRLLKKGLQM
jgi:hypothetical protein